MTRLLLVKTSSLGDVIHSAQAITEAAAARPGLEIDWAVEEPYADIARLHPAVGTVHRVAFRRWRRRPLAPATWGELVGLRRRLRARRYDLVIDAQGLLKSAAVARLAGAPVHGFDTGSAREPASALFYQARHRVPRDLHAIERTRRLFGEALGYPLSPDMPPAGLRAPSPPDWLRGRDDSAVLLHGTTWPSKRWPAADWAGLARDLSALGYRPVLPWADAAERGRAETVADSAPGSFVCPMSSLLDLAGLIAASRLAVGVDTGLLHLAAAFGVPTLALFGSTSPGLTGPVGASVRILAADLACVPCRKRDCPLVPAGADPLCYRTIGHGRVRAELAEAGLDRRTRPAAAIAG